MTAPDNGLDRTTQDRLTTKLADIRDWLSDDLDSTLIRDNAFRPNNERVSGSKGETPIPYDTNASDAAHQLHGTLREAVLDTCTQRGYTWPGERRTPYLAAWLIRHITALAVTDNATTHANHITQAHATAFHAVDTPERPHFHGYCEICGTALWARNEATTMTCRDCGNVIGIEYQRQRVDAQLEARLFTANELVDIVRDRLNQHIKPKTIHDLAYRRRNRLPVRGRTRDGQKLYRAGDVFHRLREQAERQSRRIAP